MAWATSPIHASPINATPWFYKRVVKRGRVSAAGRAVGPTARQHPTTLGPPPRVPVNKKLVGVANETKAVVNGHQCKCLVDTGSQITTISAAFYDKYCTDIILHSVADILRVEGANGLPVPYLGYVEVPISLPGALPEVFQLDALVLVVPNTPYNQRTPLCIGTNVIKVCVDRGMSVFGRDFVGDKHTDPVWKLVYGSMQAQVEVNSEGKIGTVRNAAIILLVEHRKVEI